MADWQKDFFKKAVLDSKWRKTYSVDVASWTALSPQARGQRIYATLVKETNKRYNAEIDSLEGLVRRDGSVATALTLEEKRLFIGRVNVLWKNYPQAIPPNLPPPRQLAVEKHAAKLQNELDYRQAGVMQKKGEEYAKALRSASAKLTGKGGDKAVLDKVFDKSAGGESGAAPGGPRTLPGKGLVIRSATPPTKMRFEALPDIAWKDLQKSSYVKVGAMKLDKKELAFQKAFFEKMLKGMDVPVEKDLLDDVANAQQFYANVRTGAIAALDAKIKLTNNYLAGGSSTTIKNYQFIKEDLKRTKEARAIWESRDPEIVVSVAPLEWALALAFWDDEPGPDKKRHLRLVLDKSIAHAPPKEQPVECMRKTVTHELTHELDNLRLQHMGTRYTEPRAFLNECISYQQEGRPKGDLVYRQTGRHYEQMVKDPVGFLYWQFETYSERESYLWSVHSSDDFNNPREACRWRLEMAWRYMMRDFKGKPGEVEAFLVKKTTGTEDGIFTEEQVRKIAVGVYKDAKITPSRRPSVFAERALSTDEAKLWIKWLNSVSDPVKKAYTKEHFDFWKKVAVLEPETRVTTGAKP